jgi:hypothetical protein
MGGFGAPCSSWTSSPDRREEARFVMKKQEALLLDYVSSSVEGKRIAKILGFFGVPWYALTTTEFLDDDGAGNQSRSKCRLMCSSDTFLQLIEGSGRNPGCLEFWGEQIHSAFVYAGNDSEILQKLLQRLTGDNGAVIDTGVGDVAVSDHLDDFCGVMAGVRVSASKANVDASLVLNTAKGNAIKIISLGHGAIFLKLEYKGVPVFLSTSREIIDIDAELASQNFDVRDHFLSAVPLVLYVKWAFAETCWSAPETNACLVIDDPVLKSTHGFVNFQELLSLMKRHKFSTNIAFIPWNWRRSAPEVVRLFKENPENYSVSVHGCDHTRAEFGSSSQQRLYWKAQQALERMDRHQSITGIRYDPVMVFPQGIFSEAAMSALKRTDLIAAVNNDVIPAGPHRRAVMISEMWDIAVMGYSNFPIFTRRYPWEGIENFAFDALLGKPAITVIHHDYCSDHCARLVDFIEQLNGLQCAPAWRSLGDVVRRSCRQREVSPGKVEVEMYGTELRLENRSEEPKHFVIRRRECEPSAIQRICAGSQKIAWKPVNGRIDFEIELNPGENQVIKIRFHDLAGKACNGDNLPYKLKTMLRRYLCELRDNYVTPMRFKFAGSVK